MQTLLTREGTFVKTECFYRFPYTYTVTSLIVVPVVDYLFVMNVLQVAARVGAVAAH